MYRRTVLMEKEPHQNVWYEDRAKTREAWARTFEQGSTQQRDMLDAAAADWNVLSTRVSARDRTHMHALFSSSKIYEALDRWNDSLICLDLAVETHPDYLKPYFARAFVRKRLGQYELELKDRDKIVALSGHEYRPYSERAVTFRMLGRFDEALADMKLAIDRMDDRARNDWHVWYARALIYVDLQDYPKALADFDFILQKCFRNHCMTMFEKAAVLQKIQREDEVCLSGLLGPFERL